MDFSMNPIKSLPQLPYELQYHVAKEVAGLRLQASEDASQSIKYADWADAVLALPRLGQVNRMFRAESSRLAQSEPIWAADTLHLWLHHWPNGGPPELLRCVRFAPLLPCLEAPHDYRRLQHRRSQPPRELLELPGMAVRHMLLDYVAWSVMALKLTSICELDGIGFEHVEDDVELNWTMFEPKEVADYILSKERLADDWGAAPFKCELMEDFLEEWPCHSVESVTILLQDGECMGWELPSASSSDIMGWYFRAGKTLFLPGRQQMEYAADTLVAIFPHLKSINLVRCEIPELGTRSNWSPKNLDFEDSVICDVRTLFGEPALNRYEDHYVQPDGLLMPTVIGWSFRDPLRWDEIPQKLAENDNEFLRLVNARISARMSA